MFKNWILPAVFGFMIMCTAIVVAMIVGMIVIGEPMYYIIPYSTE